MVSIIIPCYNDPLYITRAVKCAIVQTYPDKEIIIVDDGSNKQTKEVLNLLVKNVDLLITQDNQGLSSARNAGICAAKGEYILVLDSDDYFEMNFCQKAIEIKKQNNSYYKIISCYGRRFDNNGKLDIFKPMGGNIKNFLFNNAAIGNALFSKSDWEKAGGYDEDMKKGYEDWEFYIRVLQDSGIAYIIEEELFYYRQKKSSMRIEANKIKYDLWKYIFNKHKSLYSNNYDSLIDFLVDKIKHEEQEKLKNTQRIEYKIGNKLLAPIRFVKSKLK